MRVIQQEQGRYEVREVPYGKVYAWRPGRALVECDCGAVVEWEGPGTVCGCGAKCDEALKGSDFRKGSNEHPWLEDYKKWREEKEASGVKCEYYAFVEAKNGA